MEMRKEAVARFSAISDKRIARIADNLEQKSQKLAQFAKKSEQSPSHQVDKTIRPKRVSFKRLDLAKGF
jgi:hypothetical protein